MYVLRAVYQARSCILYIILILTVGRWRGNKNQSLHFMAYLLEKRKAERAGTSQRSHWGILRSSSISTINIIINFWLNLLACSWGGFPYNHDQEIEQVWKANKMFYQLVCQKTMIPAESSFRKNIAVNVKYDNRKITNSMFVKWFLISMIFLAIAVSLTFQKESDDFTIFKSTWMTLSMKHTGWRVLYCLLWLILSREKYVYHSTR